MSGRDGMYWAVTARPTSFLPGWRICQLPSYWFRKPARVSTEPISSEVSPRTFSSRASGTFGLPFSNRSKGLLFVYRIISSRENVNSCAWHVARVAKTVTSGRSACIAFFDTTFRGGQEIHNAYEELDLTASTTVHQTFVRYGVPQNRTEDREHVRRMDPRNV
jgi:hypothetical protein